MASWHIWEAITSGDPTSIIPAIQTGVQQVLAALVAFPRAVIDDVVGALGAAAPDEFPADLGLATDTVPAELASLWADAVAVI